MRIFQRHKTRTGEPTPAQQAPGWEYLLFADVLEERMAGTSQQRSDFQTGRVPSTTRSPKFDRLSEVSNFFVPHLDNLRLAIEGISRNLSDRKRQERAFGASGEPGDADEIQRYASLVPDFSLTLLDWANVLRGASAPAQVRTLFAKTAMLVVRPLEDVDSFVTEAVDSIREAIGAVRANQQTTRSLSLSLSVSLDEDVAQDALEHLSQLVNAETAERSNP